MGFKFNPLTGQLDIDNDTGSAGSGDVVGPASATDNAIARFDGTTGELLQDSSVTISDAGNLVINNPTGVKALDIVSSNAGGLNTSDSTGRINLHSYQKAQQNNDDSSNVQQAHYGEVIRMDLEHSQAKAAIAIRENYLGAPEGPRTVAWMVAHGLANDGLSWHNHFSIELPDENGELQTSLEFPFAPFDQANGFGMPTADRYVRSVVPLLAASDLYIENTNATNKNIFFTSTRYKDNSGKRFGLQLDNTTESGMDVGSDFRINRYNDTGDYLNTSIFIKRSNGWIGLNQTSPSAVLDVVGTTELNGNVSVPTSVVSIGNASAQGGAKLYIEAPISQVGMLFRNTTVAGNTAANIVSQSQTTGSRAIQIGLQSDSVNRFSIEHSGLIEWGNGGSSSRDTNLYRSAANTLKTDDTFVAATGLTIASLTGVLRADSGVVSVDTDVTDIVAAASTSAAGKVELATIAETTTGTDATLAVTPDGLAGSDYGKRVIQVLVSDPNGDALTTGDGKAYIRINSVMNGWVLVAVAAHVTTVSSSGNPTVQIHNVTDTVDMLSTALTIDASEKDSVTAATPAVINTSNDDVATGDELRIDVDTAGTGTKGLIVDLTFQAI